MLKVMLGENVINLLLFISPSCNLFGGHDKKKNLPDTLKFNQIFLGYEETQKFERCVIFHCQLSQRITPFLDDGTGVKLKLPLASHMTTAKVSAIRTRTTMMIMMMTVTVIVTVSLVI